MVLVVLGMTVLTGFSGLVFQVVWQKYFSYFLGGEALSSALVVSIFLGGLSLGYWIFGNLARDKSAATLLRWAGLSEVGIGLWALAFNFIFQFFWNWMPYLPQAQPWRLILDVLITILLISPSTILMGSTLPLLTRGLAESRKQLSDIHARVYGLNTFGAFLGSLISGFFLIRWLGLPGTLTTLAPLNLIAGCGMMIFARKLAGEKKATPKKGLKKSQPLIDAPISKPLPARILTLAFLSGFVSVGFEIVFMRSVNLAIGTSEYSYSLIVGVFISMIALGTFSLRRGKPTTARRLFWNQLWQVLGLLCVFLTIPYWGWLSYVVGASLPANFFVYHAAIFLLFSIIIALPVFFMGRTMPLLFAYLESEMSEAARSVGRIYAANTVGCCLGGLCLGYILLLFFEADWVFKIGIGLSCLSLFVIVGLGNISRFVSKLSVALLAVAMVVPSWSRSLMTAGLFRAHRYLPVAFSDPLLFLQKVEASKKVVFYRDDPNMNVSVLEWPTGERSLYVNGKSDGSTSKNDLLTTMFLGHLPGLLTKARGPAAVVGLGLGTTAHVLAKYPDINRVDVFEIAQAVVKAQPLFSSVNGGGEPDPKVVIHRMDAFRGLMTTGDRYAALTAESSNPWVAGSDRLYSTEFYTAAKDRLLPGGVFAQWMHTYEMSLDTFGLVVHSFRSAFPYIRMFSNATDTVLVGSSAPFDEESWRLAEQRWSVAQADLASVGLNSLAEMATHEVFYPLALSELSEVHSLFKPKLAFAAGQDFFYARNFNLADLAIQDTGFAFNFREEWDHSLLKYLSVDQRTYDFVLLNACARGADGKVNFAFDQLSLLCRSRALELMARGHLPLSPEHPELERMMVLMQGFERGENLQVALSSRELNDFFQLYPASFRAPPLAYLQGLYSKCDDGTCRAMIQRAELRFGYLEDLKTHVQAIDTNVANDFIVTNFLFEQRPRRPASATDC